MFDLREVEYQIIAPQRRSFADRCRLSRLQVSKAETRQITILRRERRKLVND